MIRNLMSIILLAVIIISCDQDNEVSYIVDNQTSDSLKLEFAYSQDYFGIDTGDTVIFLGGLCQQVLFVHSVISPKVYNPEMGKTMTFIVNFDITRIKDSTRILKDVTLTKNWHYHETGENSADIILSIYDSDF